MPTTILFQGDSVTDCRRREPGADPLGCGYPFFIGAMAGPGEYHLINRSVSGDRAKDLRARWQEDCLDLHPDAVSILIGINDTWRRYDSDDPTGDDAFEADCRALLEPLWEADVATLLVVPFLLDVNEQVSRMREDLRGKQAVVRRLAEEYGATLVDADALFSLACREQGKAPAFYAEDGVHPTEAGHRLLAEWVWEALEDMQPC